MVLKVLFEVCPNSQFMKQKILNFNLLPHLLNAGVAEWLSQWTFKSIFACHGFESRQGQAIFYVSMTYYFFLFVYDFSI